MTAERQTRTRQIVMTVYRIEAELINVTSRGDAHPRFIPGAVLVHATGNNGDHAWHVGKGERWAPGDRVTVTLIEDVPEPAEAPTSTPPALDKSSRWRR